MPKAECGCVALRARTESGRRVVHCPLHAAAPDLLNALKDLVNNGELNGAQEIAVRSLIAKAEGRNA